MPFLNQQRIAYAIWVYGRSNDPDQAAAVMLYVHGQMGDARPGEVRPVGARLQGADRSTTRSRKDAAKFHGPYRLEIERPGRRSRSAPP